MRTTIRRRGASTLVLAALVSTVLTACGSDGEVKKPDLVEGAQQGGSLTIGISYDEPGVGLEKNGSYSGFDVTTATYVAEALGVDPADITWVRADPGEREKLLESGQADLVFATYSITDERKQVVDFAGPYFVAHQDLLIRRNDTEITGPKTLHGRVLCSVTGTTSSAYVKEHYKGDITLQEYPRYSACVEALLDGKVDAVTTDDLILAGYAAEDRYRGKLKVVGDGFTDERYGVGVKKGDTALVEKVDAALKQYVDDGSWRAALEQSVGGSGYDIPDPPTPGTA
ncbi:transporter substrate-binding domain-containing protein [Pimelobacter simplex]|uniref:Putative glutamate transporter glutamate-binding protein n=1 Tax=Nocardioides simplex TaxID=2045 RepID=A0A0A1DMV1_NOCSI|nr:glutamate ABC transporter substrate-binding protein [Pimelobacter simplex]AIY17937.1 putative glutamate transporter glutamate-binding protein [Pimelobacter simplex]MCG8152659.1 transporter substrate-binding domain-containing protein [Pimelobacter simplex]GEB16965.1 ABC transporter substrate-binding protein [Pimelobacter simplex]SFM75344.1 amino acid ABC transporter substrate-binding protein, PAAT family [Pimelobacter simplex]